MEYIHLSVSYLDIKLLSIQTYGVGCPLVSCPGPCVHLSGKAQGPVSVTLSLRSLDMVLMAYCPFISALQYVKGAEAQFNKQKMG